MYLPWGILIVLAGLFLLGCGRLRSDFIIYRLIVARSKVLWGDKTYRFHQIVGAIIIVVGVLAAVGYT